MSGPDTSLWFKINEDKGGEVVYFKRRNGKLWKLGDGTFGVVYVVHSELARQRFRRQTALRQRVHQSSSLARLPSEAVAAITERVSGGGSVAGRSAQRKLLEIVLGNYRSPDALALAVSKSRPARLGIDPRSKIRKRANSTAVERFNRESRVSRTSSGPIN